MRTLRTMKRPPQILLATAALCLFSAPGRADDERKIVGQPTFYPWYTAAKIDILKASGTGHAGGSGVLIAPCTVLTNGHVVYDVSDAKFRTIDGVHPGRYYDNATGETLDPFGARVPVGLATNTKYAAGKGSKYDYGAIFLASSFAAAGITTYIPLAFDYRPSYVNMAGYPINNLPSSAAGSTREQWYAFGRVDAIKSRMLYTGATSTGGASGAGVWVHFAASDERRLVAVNRAHNASHDGIHVRLVRGNEDVITGWQRERCADDSSAARTSFDELLAHRRTLQGDAIPLIPAETLRLVRPPPAPTGAPLGRVSQVIENTYYQWEEYSVDADTPQETHETPEAGAPTPKGRPPARYVRLLAPQQRLLTVAEAQVLLSASALWQRGPRKPAPPVRVAPVRETFSVYPTGREPPAVDDPAAEQSSDAPLRSPAPPRP